MRLFIFT